MVLSQLVIVSSSHPAASWLFIEFLWLMLRCILHNLWRFNSLCLIYSPLCICARFLRGVTSGCHIVAAQVWCERGLCAGLVMISVTGRWHKALWCGIAEKDKPENISINKIFMMADYVSEAEPFQMITYFSTSFLKHRRLRQHRIVQRPLQGINIILK